MKFNLRKWFLFRTYIPRGIMGRTILLVIIPAIVLQAVSAILFFDRHWKNVSQNMLDTFTGDVDIVLLMLDGKLKPPPGRTIQNFTVEYLRMNVEVFHNRIFRKKKNIYPYIAINNANKLEENFNRKFHGNYNLSFEANPSRVVLELPYRGDLVVIKAPARRLFSSSIGVFFIWSIVGVFIGILIVIPFLRKQILSIKMLARAAEQFGKGADVSDFRPSGAIQIRRAGFAFLAMQNRIKRFNANRTNMLSGVSHDLRTVLTRMRLELELMNAKGESKNAMLSDVSDMEKMINGYLDFAKGIYIEEKKNQNVIEIIRNLIAKFSVEKYKINFNVTCKNKNGCDELFVSIGEQSINRILSNILENARRYGNGKIDVTLAFDVSSFRITIEDNGKGIDAEKYDDVFRPFYRLDEARNLQTGGSGLGLAIVRELVLMNGGNIALGKSEKLKGLKVVLSLPR